MDAQLTSSPSRIGAAAFGLGYLALGAVGLALGDDILVFGSSLAQDLLHLAIGLALLLCAVFGGSVLGTAIVGAALFAAGYAGVFTISTGHNLLGVTEATNVLHFGSAAVLLVLGLGARR